MPTSENFSYMMLNLVGEVGELASKVGKAIRKGKIFIGKKTDNIDVPNDSDMHYSRQFLDKSDEVLKFEDELRKEAGDILWQLSGVCSVMGWSLEDVAKLNLDKLWARKKEGTIEGDGDGVTKEERKG